MYLAPAERKPENTEQKKTIVKKQEKITKAINKNIEKTMMDRALTSKEHFTFLKWSIQHHKKNPFGKILLNLSSPVLRFFCLEPENTFFNSFVRQSTNSNSF